MYYQAAFELRIGRVAGELPVCASAFPDINMYKCITVRFLKHLWGIIEHLRRKLSWGMTPWPVENDRSNKSHSPSSSSFEASAIQLGKPILSSVKVGDWRVYARLPMAEALVRRERCSYRSCH